MSDTHLKMNQYKLTIPHGDVFVHAGDLTNIGSLSELEEAREWLEKLPHPEKLIVCGNHEREFSEDTFTMKAIFSGVAQVVHSETIEINGVRFYGEPRTPEFFNWGWMYKRGQEAEEVWSNLPEGTDVVITHGPPYGYGDKAPSYDAIFRKITKDGKIVTRSVGCMQQLERLKKVKPAYVVCGHIHYDYGVHNTDFGTVVINASTCNEEYQPIRPPMVIHV